MYICIGFKLSFKMSNLKSTFVLSLLFICSLVYSQSPSQAEKYFNSGNYTAASKLYSQLIQKNPKSLLSQYRLARSYYELKNYSKAIEHLLLAGSKYPLTPYYLGLSYFENYQFEDAAQILKEYLTELDSTKSDYIVVAEKIRKAEIASPLMNRVEKIYLLDSVVCSKNDFLKYYHYSSMTGKLKQKLLKSKNSYKDQISYYTQRNDRNIYSDLVNGNMDLLTSFQLLNSWSEPVSISNNINSRANENYPFLMPDGATLYFASDGEGSLGGYDIFVTRYNAALKDFLKPENIGFPFNSFANDYMLVIDESKEVGWFATDRGQKQGKLIIYQFEILKQKEFFSAEDSLDLKSYAKLKKYFRSEKTILSNSAENVKTDSSFVDVEWLIVINDTLEYTNQSQFKSSRALDIFNNWYKLRIQNNNKKEHLNELRSLYSALENEGEKREMKPEILKIEKEIFQNSGKIMELELEVRNEEIKSLNL